MGVQELDRPSHSPYLNPIEHLWDELERFSCDGRLEGNSFGHLSKIGGKSSQTYAGCHPCKRGTNIILICASGRSKSIPLGVRILLAI
ncbi:oncorhynchus mykiss genomic scaffold, scaffold_16565 [Trichonephila clavipes]|nr:oncorhynchus mykiss genomic scaffold, scaffold_16565 [Trichonephila clavipes]